MRTENDPMDDAVRRLLRHAGMEEPAPDFTSKVMQQIETAAPAPAFIYQPVISRNAWIFSFVSVSVLMFLVLYISPGASSAGGNLYTGMESRLIGKLSELFSALSSFSILPGLAGAAIAGWLLMALDKRLDRQNLPV